MIALLDSLGKLVDKKAAHLIADQFEQGRKLHESQYGCRRRRCASMRWLPSSVTPSSSCNRKHIAGALLMDFKSAFNNVRRGHLVERMMPLGVENDLVRWSESFMSQRKVRLCINGQEGADHEVNTGIPQGSSASPILFAVYMSGLFGSVEDRVPGVNALSFVDDVAWLVEKDEDSLSAKLEKAATAAKNGPTLTQWALTRARPRPSS